MHGVFAEKIFMLVPVIVIVGFVFVFSTMIATMIRSAKAYRRNNASPVLTVEALVTAKRMDVHGADVERASHRTSSTAYYVTFEVESGDRMEFLMDGSEYGMLREGDKGRPTFQGTRYRSFERN